MADPAFDHEDEADLADLGTEHFELEGRKLAANVANALTGDPEVEETVEGAPTLTMTLSDSSRTLLRSGLFNHAVRLTAVDREWELAGVQKSGDNLELTFEELVVALLREQTQRARSKKGSVNRAQFARSRCAKVLRQTGGKFISPGLKAKRPISKSQEKPSAKSKAENRDRGLAKNSKIKIKGVQAKPDQIRNLERALDTATSHGASERILVAMVMTTIQENECRNGGDGMFQVTAATAAGLGIKQRDIEECATVFVSGKKGQGFRGAGKYAKAIVKNDPRISEGDLAQAVQGSAHPTAYSKWRKEAKAIVDAYGGAGSSSSGSSTRGAYSQGPPGGDRGEDAWTMGGRLADEVGWRWFASNGNVYMISERELMASKPQMTFSERTNGVDNIDFDVRPGAPVDEATVTVRMRLWSAPAGSVVIIEDCGTADGRWLVSKVRRPVFQKTATVELRRGAALLREKREPKKKSTKTKGSGGSSSSERMLPPVSGPRTSPFGQRWGRLHDGIDFGVPVGTTVKAALSGTVEVAGAKGGYGNYVQLRHSNGLVTFYGHLSTISVKKGEKVRRGETVGKSGNTGHSTGPHLHFGVHRNGHAVDPAKYL